jgi:hypothetical protein
MVGDLEVSPICPPSRTVCPASPSLQWVAWASLPHLPRYYAPLRLPPARLEPLRLSLASRYLACFGRFVVSLQGSCAGRSPRARQGFWSSGPPFRELHKETGGSPKFPSYPWRYMPRSQTPVESRRLAKASLGLLPSGAKKPSAFPSARPEGYPGVHDRKDFGAPSRGLYPRSFQLRTPITGCARGIHY